MESMWPDLPSCVPLSQQNKELLEWLVPVGLGYYAGFFLERDMTIQDVSGLDRMSLLVLGFQKHESVNDVLQAVKVLKEKYEAAEAAKAPPKAESPRGWRKGGRDESIPTENQPLSGAQSRSNPRLDEQHAEVEAAAQNRPRGGAAAVPELSHLEKGTKSNESQSPRTNVPLSPRSQVSPRSPRAPRSRALSKPSDPLPKVLATAAPKNVFDENELDEISNLIDSTIAVPMEEEIKTIAVAESADGNFDDWLEDEAQVPSATGSNGVSGGSFDYDGMGGEPMESSEPPPQTTASGARNPEFEKWLSQPAGPPSPGQTTQTLDTPGPAAHSEQSADLKALLSPRYENSSKASPKPKRLRDEASALNAPSVIALKKEYDKQKTQMSAVHKAAREALLKEHEKDAKIKAKQAEVEVDRVAKDFQVYRKQESKEYDQQRKLRKKEFAARLKSEKKSSLSKPELAQLDASLKCELELEDLVHTLEVEKARLLKEGDSALNMKRRNEKAKLNQLLDRHRQEVEQMGAMQALEREEFWKIFFAQEEAIINELIPLQKKDIAARHAKEEVQMKSQTKDHRSKSAKEWDEEEKKSRKQHKEKRKEAKVSLGKDAAKRADEEFEQQLQARRSKFQANVDAEAEQMEKALSVKQFQEIREMDESHKQMKRNLGTEKTENYREIVQKQHTQRKELVERHAAVQKGAWKQTIDRVTEELKRRQQSEEATIGLQVEELKQFAAKQETRVVSSSLLKMQELVTERTGRIESDLARRAEEQHKELQQTFEQWKGQLIESQHLEVVELQKVVTQLRKDGTRFGAGTGPGSMGGEEEEPEEVMKILQSSLEMV